MVLMLVGFTSFFFGLATLSLEALVLLHNGSSNGTLILEVVVLVAVDGARNCQPGLVIKHILFFLELLFEQVLLLLLPQPISGLSIVTLHALVLASVFALELGAARNSGSHDMGQVVSFLHFQIIFKARHRTIN